MDIDIKTTDAAARSTASAAANEAASRTRRPRGLARSVVESRVTWLIFLANLFGLGILVVGVLLFREMSVSIVMERADTLRMQGEFVADLLVGGATEGEPSPRLVDEDAIAALQRMDFSSNMRARLYSQTGELLTDSQALHPRVVVNDLPPVGFNAELKSTLRGYKMQWENWLARHLRDADLTRTVEDEVAYALLGDVIGGERRNEDGARIVSVSVPVQHVQLVLGVLTLEVRGLDDVIDRERRALAPLVLVAVAVTLLTSVLTTWSIARPIRRLALAADAVRINGPRHAEIPVSKRGDEIGELSRSLADMTQALSRRMNAIEDFVAEFAHELKNPLTSLRNAVETLPVAKTEKQQTKLLGVIRHDVMRIDRLLTDISSASRVDSELASARVAPLDLNGFLETLVDLYTAIGDPSRADVIYEGPVDDGALLVTALEEPIGRVFRNLIDNALTFSPSHGTVRVALTRHVADDGAVYAAARVEDEGPGIPPENLAKIFNRFFTLRPKGAAFGSHSGLGLAIAHQIVEAHGGRIWAENRKTASGERAGARFHVHLPIQRG